jgi:glycosyltransferase involved in cell wall biosynthesis
MKIAIYSGAIPSTTFIERLIVGLAENGIKIILHGKITGDARYASKNIKTVGYAGSLNRIWLAFKFAILFSLTKPGILLKLVKCYPNGISSGAFLNWFVRTGPIVWYKPDIFHLQWTKGVEEWLFLQQLGIKVVVSLRGYQINCSPVADEDLAQTYKKVFPQVNAFHGVSKAICREGSKFGASTDKCSVVYSGMNLNEFPFATSKEFNRGSIEIISVGRPHWIKGYHIALDAMKVLKDQGITFHYRIVGGSSEELIYQIEDLGLSGHVSIVESVPFEEVKSLIAASDILLVPSVKEGIPNVVLEAMALGTIVVSTDCGGVSEVITDAENGFLIPVRDPHAIASRILVVSSLYAGELDSIRRRARTAIEQQHDHRKMVGDMKDLYRSVLQSN